MENYYLKHLNKNLINTITLLLHQILQNIKIIKKKLLKKLIIIIKIKNLHIRNRLVMTVSNKIFRKLNARKSLIIEYIKIVKIKI